MINDSATVYFLKGPLPEAKVHYPLHPFERKRAHQLQSNARSQYINRRHLLRHLLTVHGLSPNLLVYHPSGKPDLDTPNLHISTSHDLDYWIIAISDHPLGIDIQQRLPKFPKRFAAYFQCSESELLDNWMIREAYVKLTGNSIYQTRQNCISELINKYQLCIYPILIPDAKIYAVSTCKTLKILTHNLNNIF